MIAMIDDLVEYHIPEAVHIEVTRVGENDDNASPDHNVRRFSVDPQITDLAMLQSLLVRAFNLQCDFSLTYRRPDSLNEWPIDSDADLGSAYGHWSRPKLALTLTCHKTMTLPDWDIITISEVTRSQTYSLANSLMNQVERFVSRLAKPPPPTDGPQPNAGGLTDKQFRGFLDSEGRVKCDRDLRLTVFRRGVDHQLRRVVWKHLLNVYPPGLTGQQRIDYMKLKSETYAQLRNLWQANPKDPVVETTITMIKKDVIRTDRCFHFFAGTDDRPDDNFNVTSLLNILTTYSLNHRTKYCQGMSDLASPLIYALAGDEAQAYVCFCALMRRLAGNFDSNGTVMSRKFANLTRLLQYYDPELYAYFRLQGAEELLFCYRWILLDIKREFPFDHALHLLECLWSSIPPAGDNQIPMFDDGFQYVGPGRRADTRPIPKPEVHRFKSSPIPIRRSLDRSINKSLEQSIESSFESAASMSSNDFLDGSSPGRRLLKTVKVVSQLTNRPSRIRFLPRLLSGDSRDIDSPEEASPDERKARFPNVRPVVGQFSNDSFENSRSFDTDSRNSPRSSPRSSPSRMMRPQTNVRSVSPLTIDRDFNSSGGTITKSPEVTSDMLKPDFGLVEPSPNQTPTRSLVSQRRAHLIRNTHVVHCNGEIIDGDSFDQNHFGDRTELDSHRRCEDWKIPRGLARSLSCDSLKGTTGSSGPDSEGYDSKVASQDSTDSRSEIGSTRSNYSDRTSDTRSIHSDFKKSASYSSLVIISGSSGFGKSVSVSLPSPSELGRDDAFMLFLCLTMLLQHRDLILTKSMDANDIQQFFDGMVRKHNVRSVLDSARTLFHAYLAHWHQDVWPCDL